MLDNQQDIPEIRWTDEELLKRRREEKKFVSKLKKEIVKSEKRKYRLELRKVREENTYISERKKKFTTTKLFMYFILFNCTAIEVYSMITMFVLKDLSALYALIGAVVGESISYAIYCAKSFNDSKEEAKSNLERDKFNATINSSCSYNEIEDCSEEFIEDNIEDNIEV